MYPSRGSQYRVDWTTVHGTIQQLIPPQHFKIIITGVFKERNVDWNSFSINNADFEVFLDFMIQYSNYQLIFSPIHSSGHTLDVVITNLADITLPQKSHIPLAFSNHLTVFSCFDLLVSYSTTSTLSAPAKIPFSRFYSVIFALCSNLSSVSISFDEHYVKKLFSGFDEILQQRASAKNDLNYLGITSCTLYISIAKLKQPRSFVVYILFIISMKTCASP